MMFTRLITGLTLLLSVGINSAEVPTDSKEFIYGIGTNTSYALAQKSAMADIVTKLSTRINTATEISQVKENNQTTTKATQTTHATTRAIELPSVEVIDSEQTSGQWQVTVRVKRNLVQQSIKHQLMQLNEDIEFALDDFNGPDFNGKYGPACFYTLKEELNKIAQLEDLIPAYVGSGINDGVESTYYQTITRFTKTYKRCEKRNRYTLSFAQPVSSSLKNATVKYLTAAGFQVVKNGSNTGEIQLNVHKKQTTAYQNHLTVLTTEILIFDENESLKFKDSFKVKGSSFASSKDSLARAEKSLIKRINLR